ncbi:uncharacterized protein L969DRAFT_92843 [Mixia osmundae IAM 14324]|uniref:Uncharacterized protein n=1 Tax=Mixia osmundae (strain CBS 9802 / IAM 14324 / JCM 22182 / KY 12970) TaxID=764103 RepID=G7DYQ7_MIXOS|nr:uncharacterized protein L969DRAFT_92843 [Mixia osmundae IAM 14324]KEI41617.1 hypothetical protein L969DRAFT_92843 [Mixia osmundae IAM 14324]GAA95717.1 hypothetical protein E5Q_02374 [Mixia osmundae IAM 14324]
MLTGGRLLLFGPVATCDYGLKKSAWAAEILLHLTQMLARSKERRVLPKDASSLYFRRGMTDGLDKFARFEAGRRCAVAQERAVPNACRLDLTCQTEA